MSLNTIPNELILYMGDLFPNSSLNALIQTQKRFALLLTPHLYKDEIHFRAKNQIRNDFDPYDIPLLCLNCASRWQSDLILCYLRNQPSTTFTRADRNGRTLLHHVAIGGNARLVEILLEKGSDIEARDHSNHTPLLLAARHENVELVDALLNGGADPRSTSHTGISVLVSAIFSRSLAMVQRVIESLSAVAEDIFAPCTSSDVLHRAVYIGNEAIARLILDHGADHSTADSYGTTSLAAAVIWGHNDIVNLLLDRGADVLPYDTLGRSALTSATQGVDFATVQRLVKATIEASGDISLPSATERFTPLHHHAVSGNVASVELLIEHGADVLAVGGSGITPLTCSLMKYKDDEVSYEKVCRVLIKAMSAAGADFSIPSEVPVGSGITPLHLAADVGAECIVQLLIESGADVLALDTSQRSPLLLSLLSGHEAICILLVKEMRARNYDFSSPIPNLPDTTDLPDTIFDLAFSSKMESVCALLVECTTTGVGLDDTKA